MGRKAKYTKEIKIKVVNEYIKGIKSIGDIAYELGISEKTVRNRNGYYKAFYAEGSKELNIKIEISKT